MKIAILYNGLFNTFKMCKDSHKKYIFDCLDEMNIDYDIYLNVSGIILFKSLNAGEEKLFYEKKEKINDLFETTIHENEFSQKDGYMKLLKKELTDDTVKKNFYEITPKEKIKSFKIDNTKVLLSDNLHFLDSFPNTTFFERAKDLKIQINNENYSHFINIRPDFKITGNIDFERFFNLEQDYLYMVYRIDCLTVSNKMVCDIFTDENIKFIYNDESIINLKKNSIYKNNIHFEICYSEIIKKLNILPILVQSGVKLDIRTL